MLNHLRFTMFGLRADRRNDDLGSMEPSERGGSAHISRVFPPFPGYSRVLQEKKFCKMDSSFG
jgi:hypothetical protein